METLWKPGTFLIASSNGPAEMRGYTYRGLGMHKSSPGSPKGRRKPTWSLTHLGSGHCIAFIRAEIIHAFDVATEMAECGDWDWGGLEGYLNREPDIKDKLHAVLARHKGVLESGAKLGRSPEQAREIAYARA